MDILPFTNNALVPARRGLPVGLACRLCGAPGGREVCRSCGVGLFEVALTTVAGESLASGEGFLDPVDVPQPPVQLRYGHYEVCRSSNGLPWELGRGAMGITYKATDTYLNCTVALKVVNTRHFADAAAHERLLREARTAARLRHPNIASVFHLGLGGEDCFFAMEYIEGETLDAYVRRAGVLSPAAALHIVAQAARALHVAHAQHFVHRDIKPANIMLVEGEHARSDDTATVKLIDFGLVKSTVDKNARSQDFISLTYFAGTPHFASPEQIRSGTVDARSDIYSLGMCLRYMLAGEGALRGAPGMIQDAPAPVMELLHAMVAVDPEARPQTASNLLDRITRCLAQVPSAGTASLPDRSGATSPRQQSLRAQWLTGLACVLLLGGIALLMWFAPVFRQLPLSELVTPARSFAYRQARALYEQAEEHRARLARAENQRAIELYLQALASFPDFADAHAGLAMAYFREVAWFNAPDSQLDLAVESAQRAIAFDATAPKGYLALAFVRTQQQRHWEALALNRHALELDPHYLQAMRGFSLLWGYVGQPQYGLPWSLAAARAEPSNLGTWLIVADAQTDLCADAQAEACYRRCLAINPSFPDAYAGLMHLHILEGDFARARQDGAIAKSLGSAALFLLTQEAQMNLFAGEYKEAEAVYRRLLTMRRTGMVDYFGSISYLSALAFLRCRAGDMAEAGPLLEEASKLHANSDGPQGVYDLAAIRCIQGRTDDALALLRQAIKSGWVDYRSPRLDPRFEALRGEPRFQEMLEDLSVTVVQRRAEAERLCAKPLSIADYPIQPPGM